MSWGRVTRVVLVSSLVGLLIGIFFSGDELVSAAIWVGATATIVVIAAVADLLIAARLESANLKPAWARNIVSQPVSGPIEVRNLQTLVVAAESNPRVYSRRLRPHLVALAEHYLPRRIGIPFEADSARMTHLLGDVAWLVNSNIDDRVPTPEEINRFMDIVVGDGDHDRVAQPVGVPGP